jgi:hypothetical protein
MVLQSLSDARTATGNDVYQTSLENFWNTAYFPSMTHNYNCSFGSNMDRRPVFEDPYIRIGWDHPDNDIELTVLQLPGASGVSSIARSSNAINTPYKINITAIGTITDIYPVGLNSTREIVEVFICPGGNQAQRYPHYNIVFTRVLNGIIFMRLERFRDFKPL